MGSDSRSRFLGLARNDNEKLWIGRCLDQLRAVKSSGRPELTGFVDPGQLGLLELLCSKVGEVKLTAWGGYTEAERQRALLVIMASKEQVSFGVDMLQVIPSFRDKPLGHRDYLGSLVGLGVDRDRLGDIVLQPEGAVVFVACELAPFVQQNLLSVGRHPVSIRLMHTAEFCYSPTPWEEKVVTAVSPRLDALVSRAFNISREEATKLVRQGKVTINWRQQCNPETVVVQDDTISCRGIGRFKLLEQAGVTRKGRERIILGFPQQTGR